MTAAELQRARTRPSRPARVAMSVLLGVVALLQTVVITTPVALSSQDLIAWAAAPTGLGLAQPWPILAAIGLDAVAVMCVLLTVYCAWRGEPAGIFGVLVWAFALGSAYANWRHSSQPGAAPDAVWFFPLMSLAGAGLLEAVLGRVRRWFQRDTGRRARRLPAFGWRRWTPGLGATRDTYGAYRTAVLIGIDTVDAAIDTYHQLCPDGSLRVVAALRARHTAHTDDNEHREPSPGTSPAPYIPVDLMRRIPVDPDAYQRWLTTWQELRDTGDNADLAAIAARHDISRRQVEFVRRAGQAGLLDSPKPPALRLAEMARNANGHQPPTTGPATGPA